MDEENIDYCEDLIIMAPVTAITKMANPIETPPWDNTQDMKLQDVLNAVKGNIPPRQGLHPEAIEHARRIASLVKSGWSSPISLEFGIPSMGCVPTWAIEDGNHRVYAAVIRRDKEIKVIVSGCLSTASELLGVDID